MAEAARHYAFHVRINDRNFSEVSHNGHISIEDMRIALQDDTTRMQIQHDFKRLGRQYELKILDYMTNYIPKYPTPIEFHISEVIHVTDMKGFRGIMESRGFKAQGNEKFSWWSLKIDEGCIEAAEKRYLEKEFPSRSQEQKERQEPFLKKFTTSPAFNTDKSRYGNFRFTFPLNELMETYKEQMCGGQDPVLREYKTVFYKQEIMYVVLIHSPKDNERFEIFPKIEKSSFVYFEENQIVWKAQAIGNNIEFELIMNREDRRATVEPVHNCYYVWDHVSLALHFDDVLQFPKETLQKSNTSCNVDKINLTKGKKNLPLL